MHCFSRLDIHFATRCHFPSCPKVTNPSTCIFAASAAFLSRAVSCFRLFLCFCFFRLRHTTLDVVFRSQLGKSWRFSCILKNMTLRCRQHVSGRESSGRESSRGPRSSARPPAPAPPPSASRAPPACRFSRFRKGKSKIAPVKDQNTECGQNIKI